MENNAEGGSKFRRVDRKKKAPSVANANARLAPNVPGSDLSSGRHVTWFLGERYQMSFELLMVGENYPDVISVSIEL
jgi:hypothetical protein